MKKEYTDLNKKVFVRGAINNSIQPLLPNTTHKKHVWKIALIKSFLIIKKFINTQGYKE